MTMMVRVQSMPPCLNFVFENEARKWAMTIRRPDLSDDPQFDEFADGQVDIGDVRKFCPNASSIQFKEVTTKDMALLVHHYEATDGDYSINLFFPVEDKGFFSPEAVIQDFRNLFA